MGFRPLAGMSCFVWKTAISAPRSSFRPLAGMSCYQITLLYERLWGAFPSPRGDELFRNMKRKKATLCSFRPLAGMSCFTYDVKGIVEARSFRPLAGMSCFSGYLNRVKFEQEGVSVPSRG